MFVWSHLLHHVLCESGAAPYSDAQTAPWLCPLQLLLPDYIRFTCCYFMASSSTAAPWLCPLVIMGTQHKVTYYLAGNFSGCNILRKCCTHFRRIFVVSTRQWKIDPVDNFLWARKTTTLRWSPFVLCTYTRCVGCPSCSGASIRWRSIEILE